MMVHRNMPRYVPPLQTSVGRKEERKIGKMLDRNEEVSVIWGQISSPYFSKDQ
jgi:hypothetical protein